MTTNRVAPAWPERVGDWLTSWVARLPPGLRRLLPRDLVGFAILGGFTFLVDLSLLWLLRTETALPIPVAVSIAYVIAFGLNFVLNRTVNFRSHAPVGSQALRYGLAAVCDYGLTVGVTSGLAAAGMDVRLARFIAAACVATFTYSVARWWVFRDALRPAEPVVPPVAPVESRTPALPHD
jgi:putative flippase GtrA